MKPKTTLIYRKQFPQTYSIEFIFDQIFKALQPLKQISKFILPRYSNTFFNRLFNLACMLFLPGKIIHVTGDVHYAILGAWFKKRILTIHDLAFMHQNKGVKRSILKWFYIVLPVNFAHRITVISEATKNDLLQYVKINPNKIKIIPDFISVVYQPVLHRKFNLNQPKILQVGTAFNKNIERLAEAIHNLNCQLTIVGKISDLQVSALQKFNINYINKIGLGEVELYQEYINADLLTFVSTIEGFGMPILEAQACGLPVLTSNCSSMPEVAGNGALLVDPLDVDAIRNGILILISNETLRNNLIEKGFENVEHFAKDKIVSQYQAIYQELGA